MKKTALIALVALTMSAKADDMDKPQMGTKPDSGMMNVSAHPTIDSHDWFVFGDVLYWHADEGGTDWAQRITNTPNPFVGANRETKRHNRKVDFDWDWGFRVGIGYNMVHDEWDTQLYYTWFQTKQEDTVGIDNFAAGFDFVASLNFPDAGNTDEYLNGEIDWTIHYSVLDWELGRDYNVSKHLALRPHVGIKTGWISQHVKGHFREDGAGNFRNTFKQENKFWGVGPSFGTNMHWNFGNYGSHYFGMFGDIAGALMWGHFDVDYDMDFGVNSSAVHEQEIDNLDRNLMSTMIVGAIGLSWDTNFNDDHCHFCLRVGYELQYWFRQNQMVMFLEKNDANFGGWTRYSEDLKFQGATARARFDF
jgi:hypothetical protein